MMKLKNANFIEQHVEKIILAAGALYALVVLFLYVAGQPYAVEIGGSWVAPAQVEDRVKQPLRALERALANTLAPEELDIPVVRYAKIFESRDQRRISDLNYLPVPFGEGGLDENMFKGSPASLVKYAMPVPPEPQKVLARSSLSVLSDDEQIAQIFAEPVLAPTRDRDSNVDWDRGRKIADQYIQFVVAEGPRDFESVSIMAEFDWNKWESALDRIPTEQSIPEHWRGYLTVVDVVLERQALDPESGKWGAKINGQWQAGQVKKIDPLPGALSFRDSEKDLTPVEAGDILREQIMSSEAQEHITQPPFAPIDSVWLRPDEQPKELTPQEERKLFEVNRSIKKYEGLERRLMQRQEQDRGLGREVDGPPLGMPPKFHLSPMGLDPATMDPESFLGPGGGRKSRRSLPGKLRSAAKRIVPIKTPGQQRQERLVLYSNKLEELYQRQAELMGLIKPEVSEDTDKEDIKSRETRPRIQVRGRRRQYGRRMPFGGKFSDPALAGPGGFGRPMGRPGMGMGMPMDPSELYGGPRGRRFDSFAGRRSQQPIGRKRHPSKQEVEAAMKRITVWAHDITVEPDRLYRYRLRVAILNPLYLRGPYLVEEQKAKADERVLMSYPSAWTDAIRTYPKTYFYVVGGSRAKQEATVEVYRIFNGQWHREDFSVRPGEPIGGIRRLDDGYEQRDVDLSVGAVVVFVNLEAPSDVSSDRRTIKMLYLDVEQDRLMERTVERDKQDQIRIYLRNKSDMDSQMAVLSEESGHR